MGQIQPRPAGAQGVLYESCRNVPLVYQESCQARLLQLATGATSRLRSRLHPSPRSVASNPKGRKTLGSLDQVSLAGKRYCAGPLRGERNDPCRRKTVGAAVHRHRNRPQLLQSGRRKARSYPTPYFPHRHLNFNFHYLAFLGIIKAEGGKLNDGMER